MFADVSASTASGPACGPEPAAPSSGVAVPRVAASSQPDGRGRPYVSLRPGSAFSAIYRNGMRRRVGGVVVICAPGHPGSPQLGVVATRRVGNAVQRNRAKRRLREAAARVPLERDTAYVLVASTEVAEVPFSRLTDWLRRATSRRTDDG